MHIASTFLAVAALAVTATSAIAATPAEVRGEARLAKAIEGSIAGKPVRCLYLHDIRSSEIIDRTAIIYRTTGKKFYVNRPRSGARSLDRSDVLVTNTHSSQLCNVDIVHLYDTSSRMQTGFVGLGDFVPYTKVKTSSR